MGAEQRYLYDPPTSSNRNSTTTTREFNTSTLMQATLHSPTRIRPKSDGPSVDFNKHPDSYLILPYGNVNAKPMSPRTRKTVALTRKAQLVLRCLELVGAIGLMVCVICVRKIEESLGWTLRIPPAIAIMHCVYAIYHLSRSPTGRTPTSTASYMLFATAIDTIFLPFYVFTALTSNTQYTKPDKMVWESVFDDPIGADRKIVQAIFFFGVINGGLHLLSLLLSLFLAIVYRKIAKLPPDMNPLEDNLTSRHKRHSAKASTLDEKRASRATTASTISAVNGHADPKRSSQAQEPLIEEPSRSIPFMHTRRESTESFGGYRNSPRNSRADLPSQHQYHDGSPSSKRSSRIELTRSPATGSPMKRSSHYQSVGNTPPPQMASAHLRQDSRSSLVNDNWYTYFNHEDPSADENLARAGSVVSSMKDYEVLMANSIHNTQRDHDIGEQRLYAHHDDDNDEDSGFYYDQDSSPQRQPPQGSSSFTNQPPFRRLMPNPLESNPPTPPPASAKPRHYPAPQRSTGEEEKEHEQNNILRQSSTSSLNRSVKALKAKLYGDLKPATPPVMGTYVDLPLTRAGERAVSSSGTDYSYYNGDETGLAPSSGSGSGTTPRRDVSGKVAEEGRAGAGWARFRKVSGM